MWPSCPSLWPKPTMAGKPELEAFVVTGGEKEGEKGFWTKVGAAWANKSGGYNLQLDALPVGGKLVLLPPKEKEEKKEG